MSTSTRTCTRCHTKKIRCAGYPNCQSCTKAHSVCEPHRRQRKRDSLEALSYYKERTTWLESQLQQISGINYAYVATWAPLQLRADGTSASTLEPLAAGASPPEASAPPFGRERLQNVSTEPTPDASIVALNATGDARYLGPSSGIFFALYADAYSQLSGVRGGRHRGANQSPEDHGTGTYIEEAPRAIDSDGATQLAQMFCTWILPLYPVFSSDDIYSMVVRCVAREAASPSVVDRPPGELLEFAIFYLVMSLGAVYREGTMGVRQTPTTLLRGTLSTFWYERALAYIDAGAKSLNPSVVLIQILLLISMYSMHCAVASTQWQLVGRAMRIAIELGLHSSSTYVKRPDARESEVGRRAFWTAYILEITLAYNLGRPTSIGEEHITVAFPNLSAMGKTSTLHIKHRRIQHRLISRVYGANRGSTCTEAQAEITTLQERLDIWKAELSTLDDSDFTPYSYDFWLRLYHGSNSVLHRPSPLCPNPPIDSTRTCLRSAGAYIANVSTILQQSAVPLSWMLVQGVLFAGLTMLVTSRLNVGAFNASDDLTLILVELPGWTRQCSICLAIMNERWEDATLSKMTRQFEAIVDDTIRFLSSALMRSRFIIEPWQSVDDDLNYGLGPGLGHEVRENANQAVDQGSCLDLLEDIIGFDPHQSFWDPFPLPPS